MNKVFLLIRSLLILILIILILISPFAPLYSSFHLGKMEQQILKMKQNENLINRTNITRISSFLNITNSSLIKEKNKEGLIDDYLSKNIRKSNIVLKQNKNTNKVYSIIIAITNTLNFIFFVLLILAEKFECKYVFEDKFTIICSVLFILNIFLLFIEKFELSIDFKLKDSLNKIKENLENCFKIKLNEDYFLILTIYLLQL